jgi:NADPH:quinone reductase-like Zn-dependent oxidoreductase
MWWASSPRDAVFGETHDRIQWVNGGAYAEYVCVPQHVMALKPEGIAFEQAAAVPTAGTLPWSTCACIFGQCRVNAS